MYSKSFGRLPADYPRSLGDRSHLTELVVREVGDLRDGPGAQLHGLADSFRVVAIIVLAGILVKNGVHLWSPRGCPVTLKRKKNRAKRVSFKNEQQNTVAKLKIRAFCASIFDDLRNRQGRLRSRTGRLYTGSFRRT